MQVRDVVSDAPESEEEEEEEEEEEDNSNMFHSNYFQNKENPLYSSDQDLSRDPDDVDEEMPQRRSKQDKAGRRPEDKKPQRLAAEARKPRHGTDDIDEVTQRVTKPRVATAAAQTVDTRVQSDKANQTDKPRTRETAVQPPPEHASRTSVITQQLLRFYT